MPVKRDAGEAGSLPVGLPAGLWGLSRVTLSQHLPAPHGLAAAWTQLCAHGSAGPWRLSSLSTKCVGFPAGSRSHPRGPRSAWSPVTPKPAVLQTLSSLESSCCPAKSY